MEKPMGPLRVWSASFLTGRVSVPSLLTIIPLHQVVDNSKI